MRTRVGTTAVSWMLLCCMDSRRDENRTYLNLLLSHVGRAAAGRLGASRTPSGSDGYSQMCWRVQYPRERVGATSSGDEVSVREEAESATTRHGMYVRWEDIQCWREVFKLF